ncbi:MAG: SRPBCC family protein [Acidobacteriota bacterium]
MKDLESWFEPQLAHAATLPARYYIDPDILVREQESIFGHTWQLIGHLDQVAQPGDFFTTKLFNEPLLIVRGQDDELRGFYNVCRHRAGPVAVDQGNCQRLQCRYHGWTYGLDGRVLGMPEFDGVEGCVKTDIGLVPIAVATWQQLVFISLMRDIAPLSTFLEPIPDQVAHLPLKRMQLAARRDYIVGCNWKVYVDNYLEGYHIPIVHPELFRALDYSNYRVDTYRYCSSQHSPINKQSEKNSGCLAQLYYNNAIEAEAYYYWIFPNLMINVYPDNYSTNLILPLDHQRTLTIFEWYYADIESEEARTRIARMIEFSDAVQQEDISICEAVQRGLRSRSYNRGRYSVKRENGVHHFHSLLHEFLYKQADTATLTMQK